MIRFPLYPGLPAGLPFGNWTLSPSTETQGMWFSTRSDSWTVCESGGFPLPPAARTTPVIMRASNFKRFLPSDFDYERLSALLNRAYPDERATPHGLRFRDERRDPRCQHARWIMESAGDLIGMVEFDQYAEIYHPLRYVARIVVDPAFEEQGVAERLYETLMTGLRLRKAEEVRFFLGEDDHKVVQFLTARGFREDFRQWESRLDVRGYDFDRLGDIEEAVASKGIRILSYADAVLPPQKVRLLYELETDLLREIPVPGERNDFTYEYFRRRFIENPNFIPEACFIALSGDRWVGTSSLFHLGSATDLLIRLTGVRSEHRRCGLAKALKLKTILYARDHGFTTISTRNASNSAGIIALNERLGFVRQPALLSLVKSL